MFAIAAMAQTPEAQTPVKFDSATISGLSARNIGSAKMSGRIAAVDAINDKGRLTVFVGRGQRRRVEVHQRWHHLQVGVRQA